MRGWPPVEVLALALALGLALVPLTLFTKDRDFTASVIHGLVTRDKTLVFLNARFAHPPASFELLHLERPVWKVDAAGGETEFYGQAELSLPEEGIDLWIEVTWPDGTPKSVVEFTLEPDAMPGRSVTLWGEEQMTEVATFLWPN